MTKYPKADPEFLAMCRDRNFDRSRAETLLSSGIDVNQPVTKDCGSRTVFPFTYLHEAVQNNNISMVELLLRHGADPNLCDDEIESVLWYLHFNWAADDPEAAVSDEYAPGGISLHLAHILLAHGADPNISQDAETLYEHVRFEIFNMFWHPDWEYLINFFKLLILYGGGGLHTKIPLDRAHPEKYDFCIIPAKDGYHLRGVLYEGPKKVMNI